MECPDPVQAIIGGGSNGKTNCIRYIFLKLDDFLEEVSKPEIHEDARKAYHAELDEFQQKNFVDQIIEIHRVK